MDFKTKGQSDTFKLLIAAVVAMAILAIVASVLTSINVTDLQCVGNPITSFTNAIQKAKDGEGLKLPSTPICLDKGAVITGRALASKVTGVKDITFDCEGDAVVCDTDIEISTDSIKALQKTQFVALIECESSSSGNTNCVCYVKNP